MPLSSPARVFVSSARVGALPYARHALHAANARRRHTTGANLALESRRPRRVPVQQTPGRDRLTQLTKGRIPVQAFTPPPTSPVSRDNSTAENPPDNETLCRESPLETLQAFTGANPTVTSSNSPKYEALGFTNARLVIVRGDQRSNSAAHVRIGGASCNDLAVIEVQGTAGYVSVALAGANLRGLCDALNALLTPASAPQAETGAA